MRTFRHLSASEITDLIVAFHQGETQTALALRFDIDRSTVHYHIKKYQRTYPEQGGIYAFIKAKAQRTCGHPSSRCTLCSLMFDEIRREEREEIARLTFQLGRAHEMLRSNGFSVE